MEDFFEALKEESDGGRALPNWYVLNLTRTTVYGPGTDDLDSVKYLDAGMESSTLR